MHSPLLDDAHSRSASPFQDLLLTQSGTGSESSCDILASKFPAPPPFGTPIIRRMQSSPWLWHAATSSSVHAPPEKSCPDLSLSSRYGGPEVDSDRYLDGHTNALAVVQTSQVDTPLLSNESDFSSLGEVQQRFSFQLGRQPRPISFCGPPISDHRRSEERRRVPEEPHSWIPQRIIRKMASMKNEQHSGVDQSTKVVSKSRSFLSASDMRAGGSGSGCGVDRCSGFCEACRKRRRSSGIQRPISWRAETDASRKARHHISMPPNGFPRAEEVVGPLEGVPRRTVQVKENKRTEPQSFIDMGPRAERKKQMKTFITKAKASIKDLGAMFRSKK